MYNRRLRNTKTATREHITSVLKELHWLPIVRRFEYKMLLYTYKALNGLAPEYLCNMVESYAPDRVLRSVFSVCVQIYFTFTPHVHNRILANGKHRVTVSNFS